MMYQSLGDYQSWIKICFVEKLSRQTLDDIAESTQEKQEQIILNVFSYFIIKTTFFRTILYFQSKNFYKKISRIKNKDIG